jgi:hypothetical protein
MRRVIGIRVKPVTIGAHPNLFKVVESIRNTYAKENINLSQLEITNIIASRVRMPQPKINILGVSNVQKKRRSN